MSLSLTKQTTIVWASKDDMGGNSHFNQERSNQLSIMVSDNLTDGNIAKNELANTAYIKFVDEASAESWISFVGNLAKEYNKTIISTEINPIDIS